MQRFPRRILQKIVPTNADSLIDTISAGHIVHQNGSTTPSVEILTLRHSDGHYGHRCVDRKDDPQSSEISIFNSKFREYIAQQGIAEESAIRALDCGCVTARGLSPVVTVHGAGIDDFFTANRPRFPSTPFNLQYRLPHENGSAIVSFP